MKLLQNLLITNNAWIFFKLSFLSWKPSHISEWAWVWQSSRCRLRKCSLFVLLSAHLSSLAIIIELVEDLGHNNIVKHGEKTVLHNYLHDEDKGVREETIFLVFRWKIFLHESYQADEVVIKIEDWKQKFPDVCVKSFSRVL